MAFGLLAGMQLVLIAGISVILVALPAVGREFGVGRSGLALVTTAYGLAFGGLLMLGGRLADLAGHRRTFLAGVLVFGAGSVAAAAAPGFGWLVAARFGQGIGAALVAPAALALLGAIYPEPAKRARMLAIWGGVNGIGATLGLLLSGLVVTYVSWRWSFALPAAVAVVVAASGRRVLPVPPRPEQPGRLDVLSAVLITLGISVLSYGFLQAGERPWTAPVVYATIAAGAAVLVAFFVRESRSADPLLPPALLAARRRATGVLGIFLMAGGMATTLFLLSLFFQQERGLSPLQTSAAFLPYGLVQVGSGLVAGRLVGRFGSRAVTTTGLLLVAGALLLIGTGVPPALYAGLPAFAVASALVFAGSMVAAVDDVPAAQAGVAGGVVNTAMETGPTVGLAVLISLGGLAFHVAAAAFLVTAVLAAITLRRPEGRP